MTETFLPESYKLSTGGGKYLKLNQGATKIRVLSSALVGWIDWDNNTPIRTKAKENAISSDRKPKEFRAVAVWDYTANAIVSAEFTQSSIKQAIMDLYENEERGNPKEYDLTINRTGEGMETKYTVQPSPKKDLTEEQKDAINSVEINMEALFDGGEPITEKEISF